ncbi:MAG: DUF4347 domain-containing protein [candidate division Zixibacteria bacterium]|nr:DUF4347 domain-containing protein [candidate division Zixibacteria bacterium]
MKKVFYIALLAIVIFFLTLPGLSKDKPVDIHVASSRNGAVDHLAGKYDAPRVNNIRDMVDTVLGKLGADGCIRSLTIHGHGNSGIIQVGNEDLTDANVNNRAIRDQLRRLRGRFCAGAVVTLNGCLVGSSRAGSNLLKRLADILGVPVRAPTGLKWVRKWPFCIYTQVWYENGTRWQTGRPRQPVPTPLPPVRGSGKKKKKGSMVRYAGQPRMFISGKVYSKETTLVTMRGPVGTIQGHVIEVKTPTETTRIEPGEDGRALIDWTPLTTGLTVVTTATINALDPQGRKIATVETTIEPGEPPPISGPPEIQEPIKWIPTGEAIQIRCDNCGLGADVFVGAEKLETLAYSAEELVVFVEQPVGDGTLLVVNEFGASEPIKVHFYEITIPPFKNVITPGETIPIQFRYKGLSVGCQLVVTNMTPQSINLRTSVPEARQEGERISIPITRPEGIVSITAIGLTGSPTGQPFHIQYYLEFTERRHQ